MCATGRVETRARRHEPVVERGVIVVMRLYHCELSVDIMFIGVSCFISCDKVTHDDRR